MQPTERTGRPELLRQRSARHTAPPFSHCQATLRNSVLKNAIGRDSNQAGVLENRECVRGRCPERICDCNWARCSTLGYYSCDLTRGVYREFRGTSCIE